MKMGWTVVLPNREPAGGGLRASAGVGDLKSALDTIRQELRVENPEEMLTFKLNGQQVSFGEFQRSANTPGITGYFVASGPDGTTYIEANL